MNQATGSDGVNKPGNLRGKLRQENRELRRANEILRAASVFSRPRSTVNT